MSTTTAATPTKRILSIDILRGMVMVVMALDHTRDYFSGYKFDPTDLQHASAIMFFTRWITHFCAPVFVFLTGTSAFLSLRKMGSKKEAAWRLFTRGVWLVILELTFVRLGWTFDFDYSQIFLQVIWAIGISMVFLSAFIFLPRPAILAIGLAMIFGHNLLDGLHPTGDAGILWIFLHVQSPIQYGHGNTIMVFYPLIPWIGVMATGYCFGALFTLEEARRNKLLLLTGISAIVLFIIVRASNLYGDPSPWVMEENWYRTLLSFVNCTKYPPSLCYLLMTLGPAITALPLLEKMSGAVGRIFLVYGRVPLFYYVLHLYLLHSMAIVADYFIKGDTRITIFSHPGWLLQSVYIFWILAVVILYFPSRWFMHVKQRNKQWWLSYL